MASFKMTQGVSRVPEDVFVEDGMTVTSGGLTVTAGGVTVTAGTTTLGGSFVRDLVTLTATDAITQAEHAGRRVACGSAAGARRPRIYRRTQRVCACGMRGTRVATGTGETVLTSRAL